MLKKYKSLIISLAIPLAVGGTVALITMGNMKLYDRLNTPTLAPPGWIFPVVWTILYILMGIASYFIYSSGENKEDIKKALTIYGIQLAVNFIWPILFFNGQLFFFSFFWLIMLWILVILMVLAFSNISSKAGWLITPYLAWVTFAAYLNLSIAILN